MGLTYRPQLELPSSGSLGILLCILLCILLLLRPLRVWGLEDHVQITLPITC